MSAPPTIKKGIPIGGWPGPPAQEDFRMRHPPNVARGATLRSRRWPWQSADSVCENRILIIKPPRRSRLLSSEPRFLGSGGPTGVPRPDLGRLRNQVCSVEGRDAVIQSANENRKENMIDHVILT